MGNGRRAMEYRCDPTGLGQLNRSRILAAKETSLSMNSELSGSDHQYQPLRPVSKLTEPFISDE